MILIDSRIGSKHLAPLIRGSELTQLEYGDAAFSAVDGRLVGVEVKRVNDAVQCMYTGRLADHQIPGLRASYDVVYLIVEGVYRPCPESGVMQLWKEFPSSKATVCGQWYDVTTGRKRLMYSAFECWVQSVSTIGGVLVRNTPSSQATASLILSFYSWYQREDHRSFDTMHGEQGSAAVLSRPTMLRRMLAEIPRVGWERSATLQKRFRGVRFIRRDGKEATEEDWLIPREIAAGTAKQIVEVLENAEK